MGSTVFLSRCGEAGERVPVDKMEPEVVEMYAQDNRALAQEIFLPFRRLVGRGKSVSGSGPPRVSLRVVALLVLRRFWSTGSSLPNSQVETVVLEGDSVAEALVRYAAESGVRSLVLGSASLSWFRRWGFLVHKASGISLLRNQMSML
jgi:nucleotide-binding universal stress UspA family protein